MGVGRAGVPVDLAGIRHAREVAGLGGGGDVHLAVTLRFLDRLLRPRTRDDVVGAAALGQQVHRHHGELQAGAALQEQHGVVVGDAGERADVGLGRVEDRFERLRPVADLQDRHADARQRDEIALRLFEDGLGQDGGTGAEVEDALNGGRHGLAHS